MRKRRSLLAVFGGALLALSATSLAWACITVRGQTEIARVITDNTATKCEGDYQCVSPGDRVVASATGAVAGETYWLHFRNYSRTSGLPTADPRTKNCGGSTQGRLIDDDIKISTQSRVSTIEGTIPKLKGMIPESAKPSSEFEGLLGPALLCFVTEDQNTYTYSEAITVM